MSREEDILEAIINDESYDKAPQSRNEEILASIINETEYDKTPQSRIEDLYLDLKEKIENDKVVVEPLSVTENGTYTAEEGKAYSPVTVDVPTPSPSSAGENDVTFYDYDGTVVTSYTKAQFLALSEMPENPTHDRLTAQGWNWNLANAKDHVRNHDKLDIGQMYTTASGAFEIDIELDDGRLSPYLGLCINGTVTIDWGDGSDTSTATGSSLTTNVNTRHVYSEPGPYTIKVYASGNTKVQIRGSQYYTYLLNDGSSSNTNASWAYATSIISMHYVSFVKNSSDVYSTGHLHGLRYVTLPKEMTSLPTHGFYCCVSLRCVVVPENVITLGVGAFGYCRGLQKIILPYGIRELANDSLRECYCLQNVVIPDSTTTIGGDAFSNCNSLKKIEAKNVTSLGNAFQQCYSLESAIFQSATQLGNNVFTNCGSLKEVIFPRITKINQAFSGVNILKHFNIPNTVLTIGDMAFNGLNALCSIIIPSSVTSIGSSAFYQCKSLAYIKFESSTPPTFGTNILNQAAYGCKIYVPTGSLETYTAAENAPNPSTYPYIEYDPAA